MDLRDSPRGAPDEGVLGLCIRTRRTLLTFDKDFGELAYRWGLPADCGVILFRFIPQTPDEVASVALKAILSQPDWAGRFSVVTREKIRMRSLPRVRR